MKVSRQATFDIAAAGLLKQGRKSENLRGRCVFRGDGGSKCALGFLFDDAEYQASWDDGSGPGVLSAVNYLKEKGHDGILLNRLQYIHDVHEPREWGQWLVDLAREYDLSLNAIEPLIHGRVRIPMVSKRSYSFASFGGADDLPTAHYEDTTFAYKKKEAPKGIMFFNPPHPPIEFGDYASYFDQAVKPSEAFMQLMAKAKPKLIYEAV